MREFTSWRHKDTSLRIAFSANSQSDSDNRIFTAVTKTIISLREELDLFFQYYPGIRDSLEPIEDLEQNIDHDSVIPDILSTMIKEANPFQVGPMAAVAGAFAQRGVNCALENCADEIIIDNGGDMVLKLKNPLTIGLIAPSPKIRSRLAFRIEPETTPLAICTSSSLWGHSHSLGRCDLFTVAGTNGAAADAAATAGCNRISSEEDIVPALDFVCSYDGILGAMAILGDKVGMKGTLPELTRWNPEPGLTGKISSSPGSRLYFQIKP